MSKRLDAALDQALALMKEGETLEVCLERFPDLRDRLEPLLKTALALSCAYDRAISSPEPVARARGRFMAEVSRRRAGQLVRPKSAPIWRPTMRWGLVTAVVVVVLVAALVGGTTMVSANSLPGDPLYTVKLASENVRLWLTPDEQSRLMLQADFEARRILEVQQVVEQRRQVEVSFAGVVERIEENTLIIQGIPVNVSRADLEEAPVPGSKVRIIAQANRDGTLAAKSVGISASKDTRPLPTHRAPTKTPQQEEPARAPAVATARPKRERVNVATDTAVPSPSLTPMATASPTAELPPQETPTDIAVTEVTEVPTVVPTTSPTPLPTETPVPPPRDVKVRIEGMIDEIAEEHWTVNGQRVVLHRSTRLDETAAAAQVGGFAAVQALKKPDGALVAQQIVILRGPEQTPQIREFSGVIEAWGDDLCVIAGQELRIVEDTAIEGQPQIGLLAHVRAEQRADGALVARHIRVEPEADQTVQFKGIIEVIRDDYWVIAGQEIWIDADTRIKGTAEEGAIAEVEAIVRPDGRNWAREIRVLPAQDPEATPETKPDKEDKSAQEETGAATESSPRPAWAVIDSTEPASRLFPGQGNRIREDRVQDRWQDRSKAKVEKD